MLQTVKNIIIRDIVLKVRLVKFMLFTTAASATVLTIYLNYFPFLCLRFIPKVLFQILHPYYQQIVNTTRG